MSYLKKFLCNFLKIYLLIGLVIVLPVRAEYEEVIVDPTINSKYWSVGLVGIYEDNELFLPLNDYANFLGIYVKDKKSKDIISGYFMNENNTFEFNLDNLDDNTKKIIDNTVYINSKYLDNILGTTTDYDYSRMIIDIKSEKELPPLMKLNAEKRRGDIKQKTESIPFSAYDFDNRLFSLPVFDFSYGYNYSNGPDQEPTSNQNHFLDISALMFGLDSRLSVFADGGLNIHNEELRFVMSRTFLDNSKKFLGISQIQMGDIYGLNNNILSSGGSGRGISVSSFKDLVVSSDKNITISGALSPGWEVELFLGTQLIGFRQDGAQGIYNFEDIPVHYGLNEFKLVFYGPYGERHEEIRRYYSGTSPVKAGELGYSLTAYQKNKLLFKTNASNNISDEDDIFDSTLYFGLTDYWALQAGYTTVTSPVDEEERLHLSEFGTQILFSGLSLQYNLLVDNTNSKIGHYSNAQGNIYVGDIFFNYIYYGDMEIPVSSLGDNDFIKDVFESRLSGIIEPIRVPYFISYRQTRDRNENLEYTINSRLSRQIFRKLNLTLENSYQYDDQKKTDDFNLMGQMYFDKLNIYAQANYEAYPDNVLDSVNANIDYRFDRYKYVRTKWLHSFGRDGAKDTDTFGLSTSFLTGFGGFSIEFQINTDANYSISGTYNISIGTLPDELDLFATDRGKITNKAAVYARVRDESNNPVPNVGITISGMETLKTDKYGNLLIGDVDAYQKKNIFYDIESVEDFSLEADSKESLVVLRPGTVRPIDIKLAHKGTIEGKVDNPLRETTDLIVEAKCPTLKEKLVTDLDSDGYFLIDYVPYGKCDFYVMDLDYNVKGIVRDFTVNDIIQSLIITDLSTDEPVVVAEQDVKVEPEKIIEEKYNIDYSKYRLNKNRALYKTNKNRVRKVRFSPRSMNIQNNYHYLSN